jgi:hypothetical protein
MPGKTFNYSFLDRNLVIWYLEKKYGREELLKKINDFIYKDLELRNTKVFLLNTSTYLFERSDNFLNQLLYQLNPKDAFTIKPHAHLFFSTPEEVIKVAQLFLNDGTREKQRIFDSQWIQDSWSSNPESFEQSRLLNSAFSHTTYGFFWTLNRPFKNGQKPYPNLPEDFVMLQGFGGQSLALFPSQKSLYLRLATDPARLHFNRGLHCEYFYKEFLKN